MGFSRAHQVDLQTVGHTDDAHQQFTELLGGGRILAGRQRSARLRVNLKRQLQCREILPVVSGHKMHYQTNAALRYPVGP